MTTNGIIEKTEGLVLRVTPYSNTSQIVTWLTPSYGKITTLVKGACRPKSFFIGQYDLFYTCELLFYARERNNLHMIRECSPLKSRYEFRENWRAMACASYICDLISLVSPDGHAEANIYNLAVCALDHLCAGNAKPQALMWFELKMMELIGISPQLTKCFACQSETNLRLFSHSRGGIVCDSCAAKKNLHAADIRPDILAILRNWQNSDSQKSASNTKVSQKQLVALTNILGTFLNYHLDIMPVSRQIVMDMIREQLPGETALQAGN